jgi:HAE1 family hydrophobic/amphiphilic exporter-1
MLITEISIKRPVFAVMMMVALVVVGAISYLNLSIEELPNVEFPIAVVNVTYPGSSPEVMEKEIVKKIEEAVNPIEGVKRITSTSYEGLTNIIVEFKLDRNKDAAVQDVRDAVSRIKRLLPEEIDEPVVRTYDPTSQPIISVGITSSELAIPQLSTLAKEFVKKKLENSYGVGQVTILGELNRQINVELNPTSMKDMGLGVEKIINSIRFANQEIPVGEMESENLSTQIRVKGKIKDPKNFENIIIAAPSQIKVPLSRVAQVVDSTEEAKSKAFLSGQAIVSLDITKNRGANTVQVAKGIKKKIKEISSQLPNGTKLFLIRDNSTSIEDSVRELAFSTMLGIVLTIFIVYLFLNSWRSTVITGLTLPISLIAVFGVMSAFGFTLNTMTLIGLSLSVGLVIDDAIVVRENIVRHLEMGKSHFEAALEGTKEIGMAVMATTFTIVAVFVPVAFMGGITGQFFREFGVTVAASVLVSLFVSFTLDPMLSSIWIDPHGHSTFVGKSLEKFNQKFNDLAALYKRSVFWVLNRKLLVSFLTLLFFVGSCFLVPHIGTSFLPDEDKSQIRVTLTAPVNMTLDYTTRKTKEIAAYVKKNYPEVKFIYASIGGGFTGETNEGSLYVKLCEKKERKRSQNAIIKSLRNDLAKMGGIQSFVTAEGKGGAGGSPIQLSIQGDNSDILEKLSQQVMKVAASIPGATDLDSSLKNNRLNLNIDIDRQKASDLGLNLTDVSNALRYVFAGEEATKWQSKNGEEYDVQVRLPKNLRNSEAVLRNVYLTSSRVDADGQNELISLEQIAKFKSDAGASKINRRNLSREVLISGDVEGRSSGQVIKDIKTQIAEIKLPVGYKIVSAGEDEDITESAGYAAQALILAVIFIYLIMASQFNSFIQPFAIMFTLPLALIGVFITLFLTKDTLNLLSMIGVITLMGLVTKNGILLVDFANQRRKESNLDLRQALAEAGEIRLRPIVMTSLAAALGILPLALGLGAGSELRAPMARAIIGGLVTSTILTLFIIPIVYTFLEDVWSFICKKLNIGMKI